jgi:hypothetical protein
VNQLLLAVQKVELVGGQSWLEHNSVALAAIGAASLAALVAILNRRAELKHDREMRNRDHIREVVDASYVEVELAIKTISKLFGVVRGTEAWRDNLDPEAEAGLTDDHLQEIDQELREADDRTHAALLDLVATTGRLAMRLGAKHAIPKKHREVRQAIDVLYSRAPSSLGENRAQDEREADLSAQEKAASTHAEFREACFDWFNE